MANRSPAVQMKKLLDEYSKEVQEVLDESITQVSKETAAKLRSTSPGGGKYARGWTVKQQPKGAIVCNQTDWQLTHLLENSHVIRNKYGTYGRTGPGHGQVIHIKPVEEWANEELQQEIERRLS